MLASEVFRTTKCSQCNVMTDLPFRCSYCGGLFCVDHRLPEKHSCSGLAFGRRIPDVTVTYPRRIPERKYQKSFNIPIKISSETRALIIAWLVLSFCFSIGSLFSALNFIRIFSISLITLGLGFIGHELMHRNVAKRYGCWAEFRLWRMGLIMALLFALISGGRIIFAAPGAVYISPRSGFGISRRAYGIISLSGPLANLAIAFFFFILASLGGGILFEVGRLGYTLNMWLAAFNLLPFGIMDGYKVLKWNPKIWAVVAIPTWILVFMPLLL